MSRVLFFLAYNFCFIKVFTLFLMDIGITNEQFYSFEISHLRYAVISIVDVLCIIFVYVLFIVCNIAYFYYIRRK